MRTSRTPEITRQAQEAGALRSEIIQQVKAFVGSTHMFGTFYRIHYSSDEVGKKCLFNIPDWGPSDCNAQVFYNVETDGSVDFSFWDTVR